ncbi:MAG: alpha/beta hydrolase [Cytophagia bacterium]|nr:alpha/beta hydrolase [Cytophagia bacterium]
MREVYLISGLGADKRVFDFVDLSGFRINHIEWIPPLHNESIELYAKRLSEQIKTSKPIIIGVSFGGMMAVEIAKIIDTEEVVLISSAKSKYDIPLYFRIVGQLGINKILPKSFFKSINPMTYWFFGVKTHQGKDLLKKIINDTDKHFLYWAIDQIVNWRNTTSLSNLTHIHGTDDRILPNRRCDFKVNNGGHLMIMDQGKEIGNLIRKILN